MILNQVQLHNFMSYEDATLDLNGVPVACLTGANGAGKSALLDAVTWSIFEEARASSDELIRLGQREMWVDVTFSHENRLYRVRRSRQRGGKAGSAKATSKGHLEFMVADLPGRGSEGNSADGKNIESEIADSENAENKSASLSQIKWNSLTAASMKETGKQILDLLRMDYDTFLNSVYLKQGRSDEFTLKPPSERKQVLSEILGLSYFDRLRDEARDRCKFLRGKLEFLSSAVSHADQLRERQTETDLELQQAQSDLNDTTVMAGDIEEKVRELTEKVQSLKLVEANIQGNIKRLNESRLALARLMQESEEMSGRKGALSTLLADSQGLEKDLAEFESTRLQVEMLDNLQLSMQELSEKKITLTGELARLRSRLEMTLEQKEKELAEQAGRIAELQKHTDGAEKVQAQYVEYRQMLEAESAMSVKQESFNQLTRRQQELTAVLQELKIRLEAEIGQKENALGDLLALSGGGENLSQEGQFLEDEGKELDKLEAEFEVCEKRGLAIRSQMESSDIKVEDLKNRQHENLEKIRELKEHSHSSICPLCCSPIVDRAAVVDRYLKHNEDMRAEIIRLESEKENLSQELIRLRRTYQELKRQLSGRKELDKRIGQYNERMRAVSKAQDNVDRLKNELAALKEKFEANNYGQLERESLIQVRAELSVMDFDPAVYSSLSSQIRLKRHLEGRKEQLEKDLAELKSLEEKQPHLANAIKAIKEEIDGEVYGQDIRLQLSEVQGRLKESAYSRDEHARLKQRLSELFHLAEKARDIKRAEAELPDLTEKLNNITMEKERTQTLIATVEGEQESLSSEFSNLDRTEAALKGLTPALLEIQEQKSAAASKVAVLSEKQSALIKELELIGERLVEIDVLKNELEDYDYLTEALGKKGIQAVIIENAIPEIESEANRILSRLTDNKMHVALITQAKTKSGTMSETLDLVIGDELGTRNYELYSGGEAFKVNFALRIALSRLLARRAGSKLETLIIDEGFGSQDDASRERLVKAIKLVQQEFSRVLIITHIADVREMFPVQIQVSKRAGVSRLSSIS